jgi:hypothetical protein
MGINPAGGNRKAPGPIRYRRESLQAGAGTRHYRRIILPGGSVLIAALAMIWLVERAFNLKVLPF